MCTHIKNVTESDNISEPGDYVLEGPDTNVKFESGEWWHLTDNDPYWQRRHVKGWWPIPDAELQQYMDEMKAKEKAKMAAEWPWFFIEKKRKDEFNAKYNINM